MKIGPLQIVRAAKAPTSSSVAKVQGASGTVNQSGFLQDDEYNRDLSGKQGLEVFRRMQDSDGSVREAYLHIRAPIQNSTIDVDAASDDPLHLEQAELIRRAFFDFPTLSLRQVLPTMLEYLTQGFQVYELSERIVEAELTWTDPTTREPVTGERREYLIWDEFGHRKPDTIWRWNASGSRLDSITQMAFKDGGFGTWEIPAEQLLVLTNDRHGDDFTGQSILRAAYKAWYLKELVEKINAISVERHGVGINVVYVPKSRENDDTLIERLEKMLADLSAGERPYLIIPGPKGMASGTEAEGGFFFEVVTPGSASLEGHVKFLEYLRGEIKGSMLVRFSELGHGSTGARATGDVQSKVWYDALHGVAAHIADSFRPSIRRLLEKNYPGVDELPRLVFRDIDARSLTEYADALAKLRLADLVLPDKSAREVARQISGMPDEDDDAVEQMHALTTPPGMTEPLGPGNTPVDPNATDPNANDPTAQN